MGVLCIGAGVLASTCGLGQARTPDVPEARESEPDSAQSSALPARMPPGMEPAGARGTPSDPLLRLAGPRYDQRFDPQQQRPPETERSRQAPQAQGSTPAAQGAPAAAAPAQAPSSPQQQLGSQLGHHRQPYIDGAAQTQQASPPNHAGPQVQSQVQSPPQAPTRIGREEAVQRRARNAEEDAVRRRAQSERGELERSAERQGGTPEHAGHQHADAAVQNEPARDRAPHGAQEHHAREEGAHPGEGRRSHEREARPQEHAEHPGHHVQAAVTSSTAAPAAPQPAHPAAPPGVPAAIAPAPLPSAPPTDPQAPGNASPAAAGPAATDASPVAVASGPGQSDGTPMMRVGAPVDRDSPDATAKSTPSGTPANAASAQAKKSGAREGAGNRFGLLQLPPPPDSYRQAEFLLANPSLVLLSELGRRHYRVEPSNAAGLARVVLPEGAPNPWDVIRELQGSFPGPTLGLNSIYRPPSYNSYRLQDGAGPTGAAPTRHELLALIGWEGKGDLAACAAGVEIGMIDTLVDQGHRFFAGTQIKTVNLALKQDAPPAPHWHATGVLSVMAGLPNGNTPALIPGAKFTAVNVFFTNKDGQLETDTAHLTEALAYLEEKTDVQIVNMSLVGPKDDLVHARIAAMARSGKVFVGAAGNGGPNAAAGYPAAYEEVIAVTAVDGKGGNWDHANRGTYIDVAAPGVQIRTALPGGKDGLVSGTSFAAPFVTAAVAVAYRESGLEAAVKQGGDPVELKRIMLAQLLSREQLKIRSPVYGHGVISAPPTCAGSRSWASKVRPQASAPAPVPAARIDPTPTVPGGWHASVQQALLPPKSP